MNKWAIGVDLGGTKISAGVVDITGQIVRGAVIVPTESWKNPEAIFENTTRTVDLCLQRSKTNFKDIIGLGFGVPTVMCSNNSILAVSNNLPSMGGFNLGKRLSDYYKEKRIIIENDANCFIVGEKLCGNAKGYRFCCGVTLGTGLGLGIILNNEIYHGSGGWAGEIWCSPYKKHKNIEAILSGKGLSSQYERLTGIKVDAFVIGEKARQGDENAKKTWKIFGEALGYALSYLVNILNPKIIVIGGSISEAYDCFINFTENLLKEYTRSYSQLKVVRAKHSNLGGVIGAGLLVFQKWQSPGEYDLPPRIGPVIMLD